MRSDTRRFISNWLVMLIALACTATASAQFDIDDQTDQHVQVRAVTDRLEVRGGQTFHIAVIFEIEPGWHIAWKNGGASGLFSSVEVSTPLDWQVGTVRWPRPSLLAGEAGDAFILRGTAVVFVTPDPFRTGRVSCTINVAWDARDNEHDETGKARIPLTMTVMPPGSGSTSRPTRNPLIRNDKQRKAELAMLKDRLARLPILLTGDDFDAIAEEHGVTISFDGDQLSITGPAHGAAEVRFFDASSGGVTFADVSCTIEADAFAFKARVTVDRRTAETIRSPVQGLIALGTEDSRATYEFALATPTAAAAR